MVPSVDGRAPTAWSRSRSTLTIAGCPLRAQIQPDIETRVGAPPGRDRREDRLGRDDHDEQQPRSWRKARWNARETRTRHRDPGHHPGARRRVGQGRRRQELGHREPGRRAGRPGLHGRRARRRHLGLLGAAHARGRGSPRRRPDAEGASRILPNEQRVGPRAASRSCRRACSSTTRSTALDVAGPHAHRGGRALPATTSRWGELDYLLIDMPPGTGDVQMGLARMLPRTEMIIVTTPARQRPEGRHPRRRHGAATASCASPVSIENMSAFTCDHGETLRPVRHGRRPGAGRRGRHRRSSARSRIEPAVAAGGDAGEPVVARRRARRPRRSAPLADRIVDDAVPPVDMAGCSARILDAPRLIERRPSPSPPLTSNRRSDQAHSGAVRPPVRVSVGLDQPSGLVAAAVALTAVVGRELAADVGRRRVLDVVVRRRSPSSARNRWPPKRSAVAAVRFDRRPRTSARIRRQQEQQPDRPGHEAGDDQQHAGGQHDRVVGDLLAGYLALADASAKRRIVRRPAIRMTENPMIDRSTSRPSIDQNPIQPATRITV